MSIRSAALERALPVVAGFIADRTGIPVLRGPRACTDGRVIYLPRLPELNLTQRELAQAVGYVYHEVFHILQSDFGLDEAAFSPLQRALIEVLEDVRIEHWGQARFPAARRYLGHLAAVLTEDGLAGKSGFAPLSESDSEADLLQYYVLYRLCHDVLGQRAVAPALEPTAQAAAAKFPRGMMVRLNALMFEITHCTSTADVFALAGEIAAMIAEEAQKEEERRQQQAGESPPDPGSAGQGDEQGGAPQGAPQPGPGATPGPGQAEMPEQGTLPPANAAPGGGSAGPDLGAGSSASPESGAPAPGGSGDLSRLLQMGDDEVRSGLGELLQARLNEAAEQAEGAFVTMPNVHRLRLPSVSVDLGPLRAAINAIRTRTLQWMASLAESEVQHTRSGMTLDPSRLWEARLGGAIFVRKDEGLDLNAAISIMIDRSGSMSGCIREAAQAALGAMLAFEVPGIDTQVSVFPVDGRVGAESDVGVAVIKPWEGNAQRFAGAISGLTSSGGTPMAEAILFASADILRREQTLKIVLVVTDGDPDWLEPTREMIAAARAAGVKVLGLGLGVDPATVFGPAHSASLNDMRQLASTMVSLIKASMRD